MPTIVIASPKGGSGKSTTAIILGTEFAQMGIPITLVDCDPNRSITRWSQQAPMPQNINLTSEVTENTIIKTIKEHDQDGQVVIVDLEGIASRLMSRAISQADLVITPMRATSLDAQIGASILQLIEEEEEAFGRKIAHAIVFTMTKAIQSNQHRDIVQSFYDQQVDIIEPSLMERTSFAALFHFGGDLSNLPKQGNMETAKQNAREFAENTLKRLI